MIGLCLSCGPSTTFPMARDVSHSPILGGVIPGIDVAFDPETDDALGINNHECPFIVESPETQYTH